MKIWNRKQTKSLVFLLLGMALAAGCSQGADGEATASPSDEGGGRIYLNLGVQDELQTRASLQCSDKIQNVTYVQLYIFDGKEGDAMCIGTENVNWTQPTGHAAEQKYMLQTKLERGHEYLLLAVGLDDESKVAYGLPEAIKKGETTLDAAKASLAAGKSHADIAKAPVFSGWVSVTPNGEAQSTTITLSRRVAGILCYLRNIPAYNGGTSVVQLELNREQNKEVSLYGNPATGTAESENSRILYSQTMNFEYNKEYFVFDTDDPVNREKLSLDSGVKIVDNSVFKGMFILPLDEYISSEATFSIAVYGGPLDAAKREGELYRWNLINENRERTFALEANCLYSIGVKETADNSDGNDRPLDLTGDNNDIILLPDYEVVYRISDNKGATYRDLNKYNK